MPSRNWRLRGALTAGLALMLTGVVFADPAAAPPPQDQTDPPGTTPYMERLRALFAAWDLNGDNNLD